MNTLELDVLMMFYTFSDQYGNVNIKLCNHWAKTKLGILIPQVPFVIRQEHIQALVEFGIIPDISLIIKRIANKDYPK